LKLKVAVAVANLFAKHIAKDWNAEIPNIGSNGSETSEYGSSDKKEEGTVTYIQKQEGQRKELLTLPPPQ